MRDLVVVISQLLLGIGVGGFQARWNGEPRIEAIIRSMDHVARLICPLGTREELHEEIKYLKKTRRMTVEYYDNQFHHLLLLEN